MALLLDEVAKPALTERGKENTLPAHRSASVFNAHTEAQRQTETERQSETKRQRATGRQGHFNVSSPRPSPVNHGCDEPTERDKETDRRRLKAGAAAPVAVAKGAQECSLPPLPLLSVSVSFCLCVSEQKLAMAPPHRPLSLCLSRYLCRRLRHSSRNTPLTCSQRCSLSFSAPRPAPPLCLHKAAIAGGLRR